MVTTQSADSVLKSYYLDAVAQQLDLKTNPLLAAIERTTSDVWGKDVKKPVIFGVHGGVSAGKEDGSLPSAAGNGYAQLTASLKNLYGQIEITDKALRASQSNEGAFVDLLDTELTGLVRSASFNLGRMLFGDGSRKLGTISSAADGVYTMDSVRNFAVGQVVDVANSGGTTIAYGRTVTGVDRAKKTITLSGAGLSAAGGAIYVQGSQNLELTGLGAIFSSSETLYGLPREGNGWLNPHIVTEVGALTENAIQKAIDMVEANGGGNVNFIVCSWGVRRALFELLAGQRALPSVELAGGFKAISYNGIPVVADRFCPEGTMYLLNTEDFRLHQLCDWQWLEGENGRVLHQVASKACYTATLVKYAELMCCRPCGQAMLSGITEK